MPITIERGTACVWGSYSTSKQSVFEMSPVKITAGAQLFLTSLWVKINTVDTNNVIPANGAEIYILDTSLTAAELSGADFTDVMQGDTQIRAISDVKQAGGVFGYDPPAEEIVEITCSDGKNPVKVIKGRPFNNGIAIALVDPAGPEIIATDAPVSNILFVDARFIYARTLDQVR